MECSGQEQPTYCLLRALSIFTYREAVVQPAGEVEVARLVVEGEEGHVDLARGAELGGRRPEHVARVVDLGEAAHVLRGEVVGAETIYRLFIHSFIHLLFEEPSYVL